MPRKARARNYSRLHGLHARHDMLTARRFKPVLVDARTTRATGATIVAEHLPMHAADTHKILPIDNDAPPAQSRRAPENPRSRKSRRDRAAYTRPGTSFFLSKHRRLEAVVCLQCLLLR